MSIQQLYLIHTRSYCESDREWLARYRRACECPGYGCRKLRDSEREHAQDVILTHKPDRAAINWPWGSHIYIARRDFLDLFTEETRELLHVGRVFLSGGKLLADYVTLVGARSLLLRGGKDSKFHGVCKVCGKLRYTAAYPWCVLKQDYFEQPLYASRGLLVNEELRARIDRKKWKGIHIIKIPIVDEPRDGIVLPGDRPHVMA